MRISNFFVPNNTYPSRFGYILLLLYDAKDYTPLEKLPNSPMIFPHSLSPLFLPLRLSQNRVEVPPYDVEMLLDGSIIYLIYFLISRDLYL